MPQTNELLQKAVQRLDFSTRAYYRTLKLARTIADLAGSDNIASEHITEALGYREKTK
jgi:magnesium chelatase family protein